MIVYLVFILIKFMAIRKISFEITKPIIVDPIDANGKKNFKKEFLKLDFIEFKVSTGSVSMVGFKTKKLTRNKLEIKKIKNKVEIFGSTDIGFAIKDHHAETFDKGLSSKTLLFFGISYLTGEFLGTECEMRPKDIDKTKSNYLIYS